MFQRLKKLLQAKISITIVYPPDVVKHTTVPSVTTIEPVVKHVRKSNFRFVSEEKVGVEGRETTYYMTEEFKDGRWSHVSNSFTADKDKAMELHLRLLSGDNLEPKTTKTIHWEGLNKSEAETWVALQTTKVSL